MITFLSMHAGPHSRIHSTPTRPHTIRSCEQLVQLLLKRSASPAEQQRAVAALADLPMTPKVWATAVGALLPLFRLTQRTSSAAALLARTERAIENIAGYDQDSGPVEATTAEVIASLVKLLQLPDFEYGQGLAAVVLGSLANHPLNKEQIVEAGAFGPLLQLLLSSKGTLRLPAARAFSALSFQSGDQEKLIAAGIVAPLVSLLKSSSATEVALAAAILGNVASSAMGWANVVTAGAIAPLVHLLCVQRAHKGRAH